MENPLLLQYDRLSEKIKKMEDDLFNRDLLILCGRSEELEPETKEQERERISAEHIATIALRALRIQLNLELLKAGIRDRQAEIEKDFEKVRKAVKAWQYDWEDKEEYFFQAVVIILLTCPENRKILMKQLPLSKRLRMRRPTSVDQGLYFIARDVSRYYIDNGLVEEGKRVIKNLVALSEACTGGNSTEHRELVCYEMEYAVDRFPDLTAEICKAQEPYYRNISNLYTAWFYWYFGCACQMRADWQEADAAYRRCSKLCFDIEGENSWLGSLSRQRYSALALLSGDDPAAEDYLWEFLRKLDQGYFSDVDAVFARITSGICRYQLLQQHMHRKTLRPFLDEIQTFFDICREYDGDAQYPILKLRLAYNMLSAYHLETGNYLKAAEMSEHALKATTPAGTEETLSDCLIMSNLLLIYSTLGDMERIAFCRDALEEGLKTETVDTETYHRCRILIDVANFKLEIDDANESERAKRTLEEAYNGIRGGSYQKLLPSDAQVFMLLITTVVRIYDSTQVTCAEARMHEEILRFVLDNKEKLKLRRANIGLIYLGLAESCWVRKDRRAVEYISRCVEYFDEELPFSEGRISGFRIAAVICRDMQTPVKAKRFAEEALAGITVAWQRAVAYLNDHRVCQTLSFALTNAIGCYTVLRPTLAEEERYGQVLRYKNLPALVGKERNRILRTYREDLPLREQIYALQDQLAEQETGSIFREESAVKDLRSRLQHLEMEFAEKFPEANNFMPISFETVAEALPEDSAILEYYFSPAELSLDSVWEQEPRWQLEIFIAARGKGTARLKVLVIPDAVAIMENANTFEAIMQDLADAAAQGQKESLRADLYRKLVAPALPYLKGVHTLYLAPDLYINNLPFEILYADGADRLEEQFRIVRLECGRDLLFYDDVPGTGDALIIGGPDYESDRGERDAGIVRGAAPDLEPVAPLPFSYVEAKRVARRCASRYYAGEEATKFVLRDAGPSRIIHLSTHGIFDFSMESDSLYSSCLVFAGYNRWLSRGTKSERYGNGLLTADEISRMDLRGTELVVLSACCSGMGDISDGSPHGLLSAFSAAGVRWAVSHVWSAVDFVTPILMDAFYEAYLTMGMDVPEALRYGKDRLRNITVGQLRQQGWFTLDPDVDFDSDVADSVKAIAEWDDQEKPFADEFYWGGFVCHKFR